VRTVRSYLLPLTVAVCDCFCAGSSFHLVDYNATTGAVIAQGTVQGYSNSSTWSRGQAWGLYGFANSAQ
jgi:hypothetical protein